MKSVGEGGEGGGVTRRSSGFRVWGLGVRVEEERAGVLGKENRSAHARGGGRWGRGGASKEVSFEHAGTG